MRRDVAEVIDGTPVVLLDSISSVATDHDGFVAVTGSHGGRSSGEIATQVRLKAAFFNDAGVGKDDAGTAGLRLLDEHGVAAGTVGHRSARIGDALDTWESGVVTHLNTRARAVGMTEGQPLRDAVRALCARQD
jgi:hypothetical protein